MIEITTKKDALVRALAAARACETRGSFPILKHVLVEVGEEGIRFTGTDSYLGITTDLEGEADVRGVFTADGAKFVAAARALPAGDVKLKFDGKVELELRAGKTRFRLSATNAVDFPPRARPSTDDRRATVSAEALLRMITSVRHAASTDTTRPHLSAIYFEHRAGRQIAAATDAHRLAAASAPSDEGFEALIQARGIEVLRGLLSGHKGDVEVTTGSAMAWFRCDDFVLSTKLTSERFPPYEKIIPAATAHRVTVSKDLLTTAVRRVETLGDKSKGVTLRFADGAIRVSSFDTAAGTEADDEVACDFDGEARIGVQGLYLVDALNAWPDDEVELGFSGELDPITVRPLEASKRDVCVVMPIRLGD